MGNCKLTSAVTTAHGEARKRQLHWKKRRAKDGSGSLWAHTGSVAGHTWRQVCCNTSVDMQKGAGKRTGAISAMPTAIKDAVERSRGVDCSFTKFRPSVGAVGVAGDCRGA
jgi:hypothetical protein